MLTADDLSAIRQQIDRSVGAGVITQTVTSAYAMTTADRVIRVDATAGAVTVTLPAALSVVGALLIFVKVDTGANVVTINVQSPDTIGPSAVTSLSLTVAGQVKILRAWRNGDAVLFDDVSSFLASTAATATKLATARTIAMTGDVAWTSPAFDGSANVTAASTLATVNVGSGVVGSSTAIPVLTTNGKGLVTAQTTAAVVAPAGTLSGAALNGTVTSSSLTSLGTLTGLAVAGAVGITGASAALSFQDQTSGQTWKWSGTSNIARLNHTVGGDVLTMGAAGSGTGLTVLGNSSITGSLTGITTLSATTLTGTLSTPAQTAITSVGTLSGLTVTAAISGSVTGSAATVTTAAQPAITSVGTLTGLAVTGPLTLTWSPAPTRLTADNAAIAAAAPTTALAVATLTQAVAINEEWDVEWVLHLANSVATDVFVVNVAPTAGTFTGRVKVMGQNGVPTAGAGVAKQLDGPAGTLTTATANAPGNTGTIGLVTTIIVRAQGKQTVSAGTLQVLLRAGSSAAGSSGTVVVKAQSQMIATRLA